MDKGIVSAVTPKFVQLSWNAYKADAIYVVSRDGVRIAQLPAGTTSYQDTGVTPGRSYDYKVAPLNPAISETAARSWGVTARVPVSDAGNAISTRALTEQAAAQATAAAAAATSTVTWETFIPQSRIDVPGKIAGISVCDYGTGYQFSGNGHGFDWKASGYKTSESAVITWSSKSVSSNVAVGSSHVYKKSTGALVATKTASADDMKVYKLGSTGSSVDIRFVTKASNPFCSVGAIEGAMTISVTQGGNWTITSGEHRMMSDHYVYMYNGGKETDIYRLAYYSAECLAGSAVCPEANMQGGGSYS